jgi:hypothetical protein
MPRRMSIVRRSDGRLAFHNAVPLDDASMREVEAWGEPGFLLVPSGFHRLDVHAFKARYPRLEVLCPAPVAARVRQAVAVDGHWDALPPDPALRAETLDGVKAGEAAFVVESEGRTSVLLGDTMMNLPHLPGFEGLVFRLLRSTGSARVTWIAKVAIVGDKRALRAHLERLAALPGLARIVPSRGFVIDEDAPAALKQVAAGL